MRLLEVNNLKTYFTTSKGELRAVDDVSFHLDYGESLGLVGESGCGKTTSALSIAKLLPKEGKIAGGEILLEGVDIVKLNDEQTRKKRWKEVSVVFQGAMNALNPVMRVGEQIAEAIVLHERLDKKQALKRAGDLFECVEIPRSRISQYPHEFSGGMKQRAMIAMALACSPKLVIGDEPTTALDVMVQAEILNLLEKLRKEMKMGLILITHDLSILGETCDRIAVMYAGKIAEIGTAADIFESPGHRYTKKLIECFPDVEKSKVLPDGIKGVPPNLIHPPSGCPFHPRCEEALDVCKERLPDMKQLGEKHFAACHRVDQNDFAACHKAKGGDLDA